MRGSLAVSLAGTAGTVTDSLRPGRRRRGGRARAPARRRGARLGDRDRAVHDARREIDAADDLRLADRRRAVHLQDERPPLHVEHVDGADVEPEHARRVRRDARVCGRQLGPLELRAAPQVAREPARAWVPAQRGDDLAPDDEGAQVPALGAADVLLHDDVLPEPEDRLERRLERLEALAEHDAALLVRGQQLHEHRHAADHPDHLLQPRGVRRHDGARHAHAARREELQAAHLVAARGDAVRAVQHRDAHELELAHDREAVLVDREADPGDDDVRGREPPPAPVDGRLVAESHLHLERIHDSHRDAARARRLDEAAGRVDRRGAREDREPHGRRDRKAASAEKRETRRAKTRGAAPRRGGRPLGFGRRALDLLELRVDDVLLLLLLAGTAWRPGNAGARTAVAGAGGCALVELLRRAVARLLELLRRGLHLVHGPLLADAVDLRDGVLDLLRHRCGELLRVLLEELLHLVREVLGPVPQLDLLAARLVLRLVRARVGHHLLDRGLRVAGRVADGDPGLLARALVLREDVEDAVRVDVEGDLDLRDAARRGRDPLEVEASESPVVPRHLALALEHVDLDGGLALRRRREDLRPLRRDRGVPLDELRHHPAERLDAERQRRHVEEEDVLHLAGEHARLDRGADRDDLVRVHRAVRVLPEELLHRLDDPRHAGLAADEDDLVDLRRLELRVGEALAGRLDRTLDELLDELLELRARELDREVLRAGLIRREEREIDLRLRDRRQLDLRLLRRLLEALEHHLVLRDVDPGVLLELGDEPVDDPLVDVVAAEVRVAVCREHLDDVLADLEDRDVERAAAEVVDGDLLVLLLVEPVGERRRGGLVHDAPHVEAGDLAGVLRGLALGVVEVGGHRDDGVRHLLAEVVLGGPLELQEDLGADLGRAVLLAVDVDARVAVRPLGDEVRDALHLVHDLAEAPAHEPLDGVDGLLGVRDRLPLRDLPDEPLAVLRVRDDARGQARALLVRDDDRVLPLHHRDHGVRGAEVDADDLRHGFVFLLDGAQRKSASPPVKRGGASFARSPGPPRSRPLPGCEGDYAPPPPRRVYSPRPRPGDMDSTARIVSLSCR